MSYVARNIGGVIRLSSRRRSMSLWRGTAGQDAEGGGLKRKLEAREYLGEDSFEVRSTDLCRTWRIEYKHIWRVSMCLVLTYFLQSSDNLSRKKQGY